MKVSQLMKKDFLSFDADDTICSAAKKLAERGLREAPVVRQSRLIGTFSTSDLAAALVKESVMGKATAADAAKVRDHLVCKQMNSKPMWLDENADIISALAFLIHRNADCIPVLDMKKRLVGVLLSQDLRKEMARMLASGRPMQTVSESAHEERLAGGTEIDQILHFVQKRGSATAEEVARAFKLSVEEVEGYAVSLEKHGILKLDYNIIGKMRMRKAE